MVDAIVVIGSSTGGPRILEKILVGLPETLKGCILIAQHMPRGFTASLAQRLDVLCRLKVCEARNGDVLKNGIAFIAPGDRHMVVVRTADKKLVINLLDNNNGYYKPSVNILMESVAALNMKTVGVILTGMGNDGAKGLKIIKQKGGITLAQSEDSCVVFGMPAAAIKAEAVDKVLSPDEMIAEIIKIVGV